VHLRRWWAPNVALEAAPQAVGLCLRRFRRAGGAASSAQVKAAPEALGMRWGGRRQSKGNDNAVVGVVTPSKPQLLHPNNSAHVTATSALQQ
jgi:hypothetical protein